MVLLHLQDNGRTVLFYAATSGILDLVEKLLEQGADLNIVDMVCSKYYSIVIKSYLCPFFLHYCAPYAYRKENLH